MRHSNTTPQGAVAAFDRHPAQQARRATAGARLTAVVTVWDDTRQGFRAVIMEHAA